MKAKKTTLLIGILTICIMVGATVAVAYTPFHDVWFNAGRSNSAMNTPADDPIIASVNGVAIVKSTLDRYKSLSVATFEANILIANQLGLSDNDRQQLEVPSDGELLQKLIIKQVKMQEAEKLGISVSDQEVIDRFAEMEKAKALAVQPADIEFLEGIIQSYCEGLGMTREEYHKQVETEMMREEILMGKLAAAYLTRSGVTESTTLEERDSLLERYYNDLVANAKIEMM